MLLFLIYTPVISINTAFFQESLNGIVTHKNVSNLYEKKYIYDIVYLWYKYNFFI